MKIKESTFWKWLRPHFISHGVLADRLEPTTCGTPDVNAIHRGKEVWIELKSESGYDIDIKPWQTRWAAKRTVAGSTCFLLVKRKTSKVDQIELYKMVQGDWKARGFYPKKSNKYPVTTMIDNIFE